MARELSVKLTYRDYVALPEDGKRYEIHDGELSVTPAPSPDHQRVSRRLMDVLLHHVEDRGLGEVFNAPIDVLLADTTIVQPDLVFVARDRAARVSRRGIEGAPTLVVEILSPSTTRVDRGRKQELYARHGVPCYWIVDPEAREVDAYVLGSDGYVLAQRATGPEPVSLPPLESLALVPATLWP